MTRREWIASVALPASAAFADEPACEVPFDFLHNQIVLSVTINGSGPLHAILDTGTHASTIDFALAKRLGLPLGRTERAHAAIGTTRSLGPLASLAEVRLGSLEARNLPVIALDLAPVSGQLGRPLHAVLGFSFLNGRIVQVDYFRRRIRFFRESPFSGQSAPPDTTRRVSFPMRFRDGSILPVLEDCHVNGVRLAITLDTGSSLGLILFPQGIEHVGLTEVAKQGIPMHAVGYFGKAVLTKGWVRSLSLKTIDLGAVEAAYVVSGYGENETVARRGGNLGNAILQDFVVTLDYRNRSVVLEATDE